MNKSRMTKKRTREQKRSDFGVVYGVRGTATGRLSGSDPEIQNLRYGQTVRSGRLFNYLVQSQSAARRVHMETLCYVAVADALGIDVTVEY